MKINKIILIASIFYSNFLFAYCANISVNINNIDTPDGNWIVLANGSWNNWGWGIELFDQDGDGTYEGSVCDLVDGVYGYVHTITGEFDNWSGWGMVSNAPYNSPCDFIPNDQWYNYGFQINGEDISTPLNAWGECGFEDSSYSPIALLVRPVNGDFLNYTHVPFEWHQFPDAIGYNLQVSESENFNSIIIDEFTEYTIFIDVDNITWNQEYYWKIRPVFEGEEFGQWTDVSMFSIRPNEFNLNSEIFSEDEFLYEYTVFGDWNNYRTSIVNIYGEEVWNSGNYGFMMNHVSEYGQLFGCSVINYPNSTGVEVDYDEGIVWNALQGLDQHEFKQISNGNYMGFSYSTQLGPIPLGDWTDSFRLLGYQADGVTEEFPFVAQKLIEFDSVTKEIVWSWDPHDYYSKLDSDLYGGTWWESFGGTAHDWTHSNAFFFDEDDSSVYISSRHLSRITKIDYPSGDIIWMMGLPSEFMYSGDNHICSDLEFSFQHHIQVLEDGNLLFFDNGNLDYIFGNNMTSRAIEVEVVNNSYCNVIWEYELPPELAAYGMGSVQSLENGNYFINTTGGGGTVLEVNQEGDILWKLNLGLSWPNGSGYRAYRVPSIHPGAFSVKAENFKSIQLEDSIHNVIEVNGLNNLIEFTVSNHSGYPQPYIYTFEGQDDVVFLDAYSSSQIIFEIDDSLENLDLVSLVVAPQFHPNNQKVMQFNIYNDAPLLYGDADLNGIINILDVVIVIEFILGDSQPSGNQLAISDINQDGNLDVLDIVDLVELILE